MPTCPCPTTSSSSALRRHRPRRSWLRHGRFCTSMATKVHMDALSPMMEEGRLVKWNKHEGDPVKSGDTLAEGETDKAVMELVARADAQLLNVVGPQGSTGPVGKVVPGIGKPGERGGAEGA